MRKKLHRLAVLAPSVLLAAAAAWALAATWAPACAQDAGATPRATPGAPESGPSAVRPSPPSVPTTDSAIVRRLHAMNRAAIEAGRLALENGDADHVRDYGRLLVADHSIADERLGDLARNHGIDLAPEASPVPPETRKELDRLRALHGSDFDGEFIRAMAEDQQEAVALVEGARARAESPHLRSFLKRIGPILEQHRALAANVRDKLQASATSWRWGDRYV